MENDLTCLSNKGERNNKDKHQNAYYKLVLEMCKANRMLNVIFQTINQLIDRSIQKVRFPQSFSFAVNEMIKQYRLTDIPVHRALIHTIKKKSCIFE